MAVAVRWRCPTGIVCSDGSGTPCTYGYFIWYILCCRRSSGPWNGELFRLWPFYGRSRQGCTQVFLTEGSRGRIPKPSIPNLYFLLDLRPPYLEKGWFYNFPPKRGPGPTGPLIWVRLWVSESSMAYNYPGVPFGEIRPSGWGLQSILVEHLHWRLHQDMLVSTGNAICSTHRMSSIRSDVSGHAVYHPIMVIGRMWWH